MLAARQLDRQSFGFDVNHIAYLITQAKLLYLDNHDIKKLKEFYIKKGNFLQNYKAINHWFKVDSIKALSNIKASIDEFSRGNRKYKVFLSLIFSSIVNVVSNQESDTRYASVNKKHLNEDYVYRKFTEKLFQTIEIFENLAFENSIGQYVFLHNAKTLCEKIFKDSISLVLTSPPYPNTYDYYLYHKHRMLWLDFDVKFSMQNEIGSRREYSSLKLPKEKFNNDLLEVFRQCGEVLKNDSYIVLVMGDGKIQGEIYNAKDEILTLTNKLNWDLVDYSCSELDQTSRSFAQNYRTKHKKEHILTFQRVKMR
ncbi:hypothetical protein NHP190003_16300 (plasmid) [Helicobacter sp. NHP19-003]|uniref:site-specific DNA-methyltransferase (cytosine-N(4)-specific) n=1 Tax=Helicobacter gastrocanis TaxID=2849641 RepID=A0ABN6I406_9HELI|nr:hypothetical protein NHP190003_16300 [Helicobacter sp. NHP19-003]